MAILDLSHNIWREALGMPPGEEPHALVLEGTWWREQATAERLVRLEDVKELAFPDMFTGTFKGARIAYCCAYGAARAVEPAHIFAHMGTPLLIQIGTCGTLDERIGTGIVVLPDACATRDGVSRIYGTDEWVQTDPAWRARADDALQRRNLRTRHVTHLTWPSLFAQSDAMCDQWAAEGLLSVDMETATVAAVARHFGVASVSMLTVWDALPKKRTFLDPLEPHESAALKRANEAVFDVALDLAERAAGM